MIEAYIDYLRHRHYSDSTLKGIRRNLQWFVAWLKETDLRDVTIQDLLDYQTHIRSRKKPGGGTATGAYQHKQMWDIRKWFEFLYEREKILINPARLLPPLHKPRRLPKGVLAAEQVNAILAAVPTDTLWGFRDRTLLELIYSSGLRPGEACKLTIYDLDFKERLVRIVQGKGRKDRVVPAGITAFAYLREYLDRVRPALLTRFALRKDRPSAQAQAVMQKLFFNRNRNPLTTVQILVLVRSHAKAARITGRVTAHGIRHACATEMLRGGAGVRHVQEMLGHANLNTTEIYTHVLPYDLKKVHAATAPSERRRVIRVPKFEFKGWRDKKNGGHY